MAAAGKFGLVCELAGFDEVNESDSEGHHLGDAGKPTMGLRFLFAAVSVRCGC